jgi:hypothetical protein
MHLPFLVTSQSLQFVACVCCLCEDAVSVLIPEVAKCIGDEMMSGCGCHLLGWQRMPGWCHVAVVSVCRMPACEELGGCM